MQCEVGGKGGELMYSKCEWFVEIFKALDSRKGTEEAAFLSANIDSMDGGDLRRILLLSHRGKMTRVTIRNIGSEVQPLWIYIL